MTLEQWLAAYGIEAAALSESERDSLRAVYAAGNELLTVRAAASSDGSPIASVNGVAYRGGLLRIDWPYPVGVEISGLRILDSNPLLADHVNKTITQIGQVRARAVGRTVAMEGEILSTSGTAKGIIEQAVNAEKTKSKLAWQLSIGADPIEYELIEAGNQATVNGQVQQGPFYHVKQSILREISVLPCGADTGTFMRVAAAWSLSGGKPMNFEKWLESHKIDAAKLTAEQRETLQAAFAAGKPPVLDGLPMIQAAATISPGPRREVVVSETDEHGNAFATLRSPDIQAAADSAIKAERARVAAIRKLCNGEHAEIETSAIESGESPDGVAQRLVKAMRAARPQHAAHVHLAGAAEQVSDARTLEAALCLRHRVGSDQFLTAQYGQETMNRADSLRRLPFSRMMEICAMRAGLPVPLDVLSSDFIRAAFSTSELSGIVGNVANKALAAAFAAAEAVIPQIAAQRSHGNFHAHKVYSMALTGDLQPVAPDGELKHLKIGEESWTRQVGTRGAILSLTRQDIINDELGAFTDMATRLGMKAAVSREKAGFTLLNATGAGSSFFTTAHGNYWASASTSLLDLTGLGVGVQMFRDQTNPDGDPLGISPRILLVPTALEAQARALMNAQNVFATGIASTKAVEPQINIYAGAFKPLTSPWMSNANLTGHSALAWLLLADPAALAAIEIAYLNGIDTPVVEFFGLNAEAATLGVTWRVYYDFGVALAEYRAGVKAKGAA